MTKSKRISLEECVAYYKVDASFVQQLGETGLVQVVQVNKKTYIPHDQLGDLEKYSRLHYDLDINMAGLEAISHLLKKISSMQNEMMLLKNRF